MTSNVRCLVIICLNVAVKSSAELTSTVRTTNGPVQGEILTTVWNSVPYASFKGIPYARPPVGQLRFKPPVEPEAWTETLQATSEGSVCPQIDFIFNDLTGNEDCLYLNVYTPKTNFQNNPRSRAENLRAVIVWIYGGSFYQGYVNSSLYGPDFLIEEGVVIVAMNYRLGALGFLSLDHPQATGNAGLKDQLLALKWVKSNIEYFGGDPNMITIFGQSAGGVSVDLHVISEKSRGLFHRSITFSASVYCLWGFQTPTLAESRAFQLGALMGKFTTDKDDLLNFLCQQPADDIVLATQKLTIGLPPFTPTVENARISSDTFLSQCPVKNYEDKTYQKMDHLMGYAKNELLLFAKELPAIIRDMGINSEFINTVIGHPSLGKMANLDRFTKAEYLHLNASTEVFLDFVNVLSDLIFVAEIDWKQKVLSPSNDHPIYYYRLSYDSPHALHRALYGIDLPGTAHGDDFGYVFNTAVVQPPTDPSNRWSIFRKKMARLVANFAKYGNPTPDGAKDELLNVTWPDSRENGLQADINDAITIRNRLASELAEITEPIVALFAPFYTGCGET